MVWVHDVIHTNLDNDTALETAALVECRLGNQTVTQVVGYDVDAAGRPVSMGAIVKPPTPNHIEGLTHRYDGGVIVTVMIDRNEFINPQPQRREFAWDGTAFRQVGGPTAFPERLPGDFSITAGPLRLEPMRFGKRMGSIRVTVKNKGANATPFITIGLAMRGLEIVGTDHANVTTFAAPPPGETKVYEIVVEVRPDSNQATVAVDVNSYIQDTAPDDNIVIVSINRL